MLMFRNFVNIFKLFCIDLSDCLQKRNLKNCTVCFYFSLRQLKNFISPIFQDSKLSAFLTT